MPFVRRWQRWQRQVQRRLSRHEATLELGLGNLYILPSSFGALWLLTAAVLYLVGINGRSNGPVLLSLLMLGLVLLNLFLTHLNLQGLRLSCLESPPRCVDEPIGIILLAISSGWRPSIKLRWLGQDKHGLAQPQQIVHIKPGQHSYEVAWAPAQRGLQQPGRLFIHTTAPMGLFRCWSYWEPPLQLAIAPGRSPGPVEQILKGQAHSLSSSSARQAGGSDDFRELSPLRPQEGLQRVAWKTVARGQGWYGKRFDTERQSGIWLAPARGLPRERSLEFLCERLHRGLLRGETLGLMLPGGQMIAPGTGQRQLELCLAALAAIPFEPSGP